MVRVIFIVATIFLISLIVYLTLKRKIKCSNCKSLDVSATGQKRYSEDNLAIHGSPSSYHELEYKCNKCGNTFCESKESIIFN